MKFPDGLDELQAKVAQKSIDHYGLTRFFCTVLKNIAEQTTTIHQQSVCFNGHFFSWYFMDYITKVYTALINDDKGKPLLSYMHFNTGHEMSGVRMINLDPNLAKFFHDMVGLRDTLIMIFADHGHKVTPVSYTEEGRAVLFHPAFFMVVPGGVKEILGPQRISAMETYQKRLFIVQDVHKALMSFNDPEKMNPHDQDFSQTGIFSVISANRTCADLYMFPLTRRKYAGFNEEGHIQDNADSQKWLAKLSLATINDAIQKQ